jgi:hypothetical protein
MAASRDHAMRLVAAQFALTASRPSTNELLDWLHREPRSDVRADLYLCIAFRSRGRVAAFLRQRLASEAIEPVERLHIQAALCAATHLRSDLLPVLDALRSPSRKLARAAAQLVIMLCNPDDRTTLEFAQLLLRDRHQDAFTRSLGEILSDRIGAEQ